MKQKRFVIHNISYVGNGQGWDRTTDLVINSHTHYRLCYSSSPLEPEIVFLSGKRTSLHGMDAESENEQSLKGL